MKKRFLALSMNMITKNGNYTDEKLEMISYGLEAIYLTITKLIIIFSLAYILGIIKEILLLLITYNIIRSQAFGIHASKSIYCLISSLVVFIGGALICKYIIFPTWASIIISIICVICLILYAPADTLKRPLVNIKKRKKFKFFSSFLGIIYTLLIICFYDSYIVNYLLLGMLDATIMILPLTYKIFKLPYNNYKTYEYGV